MPDFSFRHSTPEIMDQPGRPFSEIQEALRELHLINSWLGGYEAVWQGLKSLGILQKSTLHVTDWACGGGEMLREIAKKGRKAGLNLELTGIDINPHMLDYAREICKDFPEINFYRADVFNDKLPVEHDYVLCNLFAHHTNGSEFQELISRMHQSARKGIVLNDLHRHPLAYYSIRLLTMLFSKSELVKYDGPVSVLRAFKRKEIEDAFRKAGIKNYSLQWKWAFRWLICAKTE